MTDLLTIVLQTGCENISGCDLNLDKPNELLLRLMLITGNGMPSGVKVPLLPCLDLF